MAFWSERVRTQSQVHENTISALILVNVHGEVEAEEDAAASGRAAKHFFFAGEGAPELQHALPLPRFVG